MTDDLRTRIAAVLWSTGWGVHNHGTEQGDGLACRERLVDGQLRGDCYWKQADAVIAELGLKRCTRYVTDWKADDE